MTFFKSLFVIMFLCICNSVHAEGTWTVFPVPEIGRIAIGNDGSLWVGSFQIHRYDFIGETWTTYNKEKVLYDSVVTSICITSDGAVWFGTQKEALRYDGENWKKFTYHDGLPSITWNGEVSSSIWDIKQSPTGKIWFTGEGGISIFDGNKWQKITEEEGLPSNYLSHVGFGHDGSVWVSSRYGAYRYFNSEWQKFTTKDGLVYDFVRCTAIAPDGTVWFGSPRGACCYKDGIWKKFTEYNGLVHRQVVDFVFDNKDNVWIGTLGGINVYDGSEIIKTYTIDNGLLANNIGSMVKGANNEIWITSGKGMNVYVPDAEPLIVVAPADSAYLRKDSTTLFSWEQYQGAQQYEVEFSDNRLFTDAEKVFVTDTSLSRTIKGDFPINSPVFWRVRSYYNETKTYWSPPRIYFTVIEPPKLLNPSDMQIVEQDADIQFSWNPFPDATGYEIEFADNSDFINGESFVTVETSYDRQMNTVIWKDNPAYWRVRSLIQVEHNEWSLSRRYYTQEMGKWTVYNTDNGLINNNVNSLAITSGGTLWAGTETGISSFDGETWTSYTYDDGLANDYVNTVAVDDDIVWIGTEFGLSRFDGNTWATYTMLDGLPDNNIISIVFEESGRMWIGTENGSMSEFDGKQFINYELADSSVEEISIAPNGDVWAATLGDGILHFTGDSWMCYSANKGLPGNYAHCLTIDSAGTVWVSISSSLYFSDALGVFSYDGISWTRHFPDRTVELVVGPDKKVWAQVADGRLLKFDGKSWELDDKFKWESGSSWSYNHVLKNIVFSHDDTFWGAAWATHQEHGPFGGGIYAYKDYIITPVEENMNGYPASIIITGNYPNPFNPSTTIEFTLPQNEFAELAIYNITGQKVRTLIAAPMTAGNHTVLWNGENEIGENVSSGVYISHLKAGINTATHRLLLMK